MLKQRSTSFGQYVAYLTLNCLGALLPLISYWVQNLGQVRPSVVVQPLLIILAFALVFFTLFSVILRSFQKATLILFLFYFLFFSYGHIAELTSRIHLWGWSPHPILIFILYILGFLAGMLLIFRIKMISPSLILYLQVVICILFIYNAGRIAVFNMLGNEEQPSADPSIALASNVAEEQPDVYLIILDAYARDDILLSDYGFDNSGFLKALESRGFYIPGCVLSNYSHTHDAIPTVLNMDYLDQLGIPRRNIGQLSLKQVSLIQKNKVRKVFADYGYQFVSTRGYGPFNDIADADIYLNYYSTQGQTDELNEQIFLYLFLDTTLVNFQTRLLQANESDDPVQMVPETSGETDTASLKYQESEFWYNQTNYVFDALEELPEKTGAYLVYAHINSPHGPYVFNQDGSFRFAPDLTDEKTLYTDTLVYLNRRVLELVDALIQKSSTPPIIILQADHGTHLVPEGADKHKILSAYYLPGELSIQPYATITPVNNFRLILHNYFDPAVNLLPDVLFVKKGNKYEMLDAACGQ